MAKKRKRRRMSLLTKVINGGVLALAFARPIQFLLSGGFSGQTLRAIADEASFGLASGQNFDFNKGLPFYGPMLAAVLMKKAISMVRKTAHV